MGGSLGRVLVEAVILLNGYSLGANCVERFVNYASWPRLAEAEFGPYHRAQQPAILGFVVAPLVVGLVLELVLLVDRPAWVGLWVVVTLVGASVAGFVSTVVLQIPIHRKLDEGYSEPLVERLLRTDWIRKAADSVRLVATVALLGACLR